VACVNDSDDCYTKDFWRPRSPWWGLFGDENHVGFYVVFLYRLLDFWHYVLCLFGWVQLVVVCLNVYLMI